MTPLLTLFNEAKWIQKAIKKPGALHKQLGVPEGKKIPASKLETAAEKGGKLGKRARLAQTLKKLHESEILEEGTTPHQELRAQGWKKSHRIVSTGANHDTTVYTHPHHTGHEIHLHPSGHFEHKVAYGPEHVQKGKAAKGMSLLGKHLDAHSRTTDYDAHTRAEARRKLPGGDWT